MKHRPHTPSHTKLKASTPEVPLQTNHSTTEILLRLEKGLNNHSHIMRQIVILIESQAKYLSEISFNTTKN